MAGFNTKEGKKSNKTRGLKLVYDFDPVSTIWPSPYTTIFYNEKNITNIIK